MEKFLVFVILISASGTTKSSIFMELSGNNTVMSSFSALWTYPTSEELEGSKLAIFDFRSHPISCPTCDMAYINSLIPQLKPGKSGTCEDRNMTVTIADPIQYKSSKVCFNIYNAVATKVEASGFNSHHILLCLHSVQKMMMTCIEGISRVAVHSLVFSTAPLKCNNRDAKGLSWFQPVVDSAWKIFEKAAPIVEDQINKTLHVGSYVKSEITTTEASLHNVTGLFGHTWESIEKIWNHILRITEVLAGLLILAVLVFVYRKAA